MAHDTTRSVDPEQGTEVPSVEVEGQRFRVHTPWFATQWLPDTPSNRHLTLVWCRLLVDAHGKPLFTLQELAVLVGSANRQAASQHLEDFRQCGEDVRAFVLRKRKISRKFETDQDRHRELQRSSRPARKGKAAPALERSTTTASMRACSRVAPPSPAHPTRAQKSHLPGRRSESRRPRQAPAPRRRTDEGRQVRVGHAAVQRRLQVAPNNGMVLLGLAHAELGAGLMSAPSSTCVRPSARSGPDDGAVRSPQRHQ